MNVFATVVFLLPAVAVVLGWSTDLCMCRYGLAGLLRRFDEFCAVF